VGVPQLELLKIPMFDIRGVCHTKNYLEHIDWDNPTSVEAAEECRQNFIDERLKTHKIYMPWTQREKDNVVRLLEKRMETADILTRQDYVDITNEHNESFAGFTVEQKDELIDTWNGKLR
jgi:hypothetical protein